MRQSIVHYLSRRGTIFSESGGEIITRCVFSGCDEDSHGREAHLYISSQTGQYHCKKCGSQGNMVTLTRHLGDDPAHEGFLEKKEPREPVTPPTRKTSIAVSEKDVERYHKNLPDEVRAYLHGRGITDETITREKLGWGTFYNANWITIPVRDMDGKLLFLKLRRDPKQIEGNKYMCYPSGGTGWGLYGAKWLKDNTDYIVICEGEFDQMMLEQAGIIAITSTAGATTFKEEWIAKLEAISEIYICLDNDEVGKKAMANLAERLRAHYPLKKIATVDFPPDFAGKDITDFIGLGGNIWDMLTKSTPLHAYDTSGFEEMGVRGIIDVLGLTIKRDDMNKVLVFLAMLSAYTEDSQLNIFLSAPSSSWKTYIPMQIAKLFPKESLMEIAYSSQTAFFHEGEYDKDTNTTHNHLERKILIFLDQPKPDLLARLRPLLSHDEKELVIKITDKNKQGGNQTKKVILHGYPVAVFCTASSGLDEQESTRFLLVSPEIDENKIRDALHEKMCYEADHDRYMSELENNPIRKTFKERIRAIKDLHIRDIRLHDPERMRAIFIGKKTVFKPQHQRDFGKFLTLVKMIALLNFPHREMQGDSLLTNDFDIVEAEKVWRAIEDTTEYGISPYIMKLYKEVVVPVYYEYNEKMRIGDSEMIGVPRKEILVYHLKKYGRSLTTTKWRQELESMLESAGLITTEYDANDGRIVLITPFEERMNI